MAAIRVRQVLPAGYSVIDALADWAAALRGVHDSPLTQYFRLTEERRFARLTWLQRHFWLIPLTAALLVVGIVEAVERAAGDSMFFDVGSAEALQVLVFPFLISGAVLLYLAFARMFAGCYGLLAARAQRGVRLHLDELTALTSLSSAEVVAGTVRHYFPVVFRMLALFQGLLLLWVFLSTDPGWNTFWPILSSYSALLLFGSLSALFYALAWVTMGRGRRFNSDFGWVFIITLLLWVVLGLAGQNVLWQLESFAENRTFGMYNEQVASPFGLAFGTSLLLFAISGSTLVGAARTSALRALTMLAVPLLITGLVFSQLIGSSGMGYLLWEELDLNGSFTFLSFVYECGALTPLPLGVMAVVDSGYHYGCGYEYMERRTGFHYYLNTLVFLILVGLNLVAAYSSTLAVERHRRGLY